MTYAIKNWHKNFVSKVKEETGCSQQEAMRIAGWVAELKQAEYMSGYSQGYNAAHNEEDQTSLSTTS